LIEKKNFFLKGNYKGISLGIFKSFLRGKSRNSNYSSKWKTNWKINAITKKWTFGNSTRSFLMFIKYFISWIIVYRFNS